MASYSYFHKKIKKRKSLSQKMAFTFFYFVIFPCIVLSFLSAFFFQRGIHSWFKERIQTAMISANILSHNYIQNNFSHINKASDTLVKEIALLKEKDAILNYSQISELLDLNEAIGDYSSVLFEKEQDQEGPYQTIVPLSFSKKWNQSIPLKISVEKIKEAQQKTSSVFLNPRENHLSILRHIHSNIFLIVGKSLDPFIIQNIFNAKSSINSYIDDLKQEKRWFWSSIVLFLLSCSVLIALSFWGTLFFKRDIIQPVNALLWGVQMMIQDKDALVDVNTIKASKEFLFLMESFNKMSSDIKEKKEILKQANKDLCEKNIFMETVFQSVSSGIIILSEKGSILLCNEQAEKLLLAEKTVNKNIATFHKKFKTMLEKAVRDPKKMHTQEIFSKKNMKTYRIHMRYNQPTHNIIVTLDDVGHLIASQKREAFLDIARRVAHEVRNPLTPIVLSAQRLGRLYTKNIKDKEVFQNCLDAIVRHSETIGNIVKEFSYFVRMPSIQFQHIDLSALIKQNIDFHKSAYPHVDFQSHLFQCFVWCDPSQIERAITNLIKNALEATENNENKRIIILSIKENKKSIQIIIKDNGMGLSKKHVLSNPEPYCSQKSQGMGLGLSIVEKISLDHGGSFSIYNNENEKGATATINIAERTGSEKKSALKRNGILK
jgi:two-component system nitrogen regulation sensor histidine kinase NtrY